MSLEPPQDNYAVGFKVDNVSPEAVKHAQGCVPVDTSIVDFNFEAASSLRKHFIYFQLEKVGVGDAAS